MTANEEQVLKDFMVDINCLKQLNKWTGVFNLFDVLKITNAEIRHSNILAWFFDPNENHGLGDSFIKSFITKIVSKGVHDRHNVFELLLQNFYSYQVRRELNNMDIVLISPQEKTVVIIENKIWSKESSHQLETYIEKAKVEYKGYKNILYVFLTPDGIEASDSENWVPFSYGEIVEILESVSMGVHLRDEIVLLVNNYIDMVRRHIMKEKDEKLIEICNEIYNTHRAALQLIFENVNINNSIDHEIICETLRELDTEGTIIMDNKNKWNFFTPSMDSYMPLLDNNNSSWGTKRVYSYWLEKNEDKLIIHFELGGWNLTEDLKQKTNSLIRASNKEISKYRYKRIYYKSEKLSEEDYEDSLKNATKTLVEFALENEKKLLLGKH